MRKILVLAVLAAALAASSGGSAAQLLATARFEEVQKNLPHARKLYREIVEKHPDAPQAAESRARLAEIGE